MSHLRKSKIPFTQVSNNILTKNISLQAWGLYFFMQSKPDNWNFTIRSMSSQMKSGSRAITTAIDELKRNGFLSYTKNTDGSGVYTLHTESQCHVDDMPHLRNANVANGNPFNNTYLTNNKDSLIIKEEEVGQAPAPQISFDDVENFVDWFKKHKKTFENEEYALGFDLYDKVSDILPYISLIDLKVATTRWLTRFPDIRNRHYDKFFNVRFIQGELQAFHNDKEKNEKRLLKKTKAVVGDSKSVQRAKEKNAKIIKSVTS